MATHSSILAWKIPWTEEPGRLQSMGSQKSRTQLSDFTYLLTYSEGRASQVALVVKNCLPMQVEVRNVGLIPGSGRSPGRGHGNPLQYSCLENPIDRVAWWATVHRVAKSWTRLKQLSTLPTP